MVVLAAVAVAAVPALLVREIRLPQVLRRGQTAAQAEMLAAVVAAVVHRQRAALELRLRHIPEAQAAQAPHLALVVPLLLTVAAAAVLLALPVAREAAVQAAFTTRLLLQQQEVQTRVVAVAVHRPSQPLMVVPQAVLAESSFGMQTRLMLLLQQQDHPQ
jgi:hypothetical protein